MFRTPLSRRLTKPLWLLLAVLFLIEAWVWDLVSPLVRRVVALLPWEAAKARVAQAVAGLPPVVVLFIFILPHAIALPVELLGLWFAARGAILTGVVLYAVSKGISVVFTLLLFEVCKPKLMQLEWFAQVYQCVIALRAWAHRQVDPVRRALGEALAALRTRLFGERQRMTRLMRRLRNRARPSS
jgi:hypothetical protein